jgi:hypothetical protein
MIGVAQDYLEAELRNLLLAERLHARLRTDRHKDRRFDNTVRGIQASPPRVADRGCIQYLKGKCDTHATIFKC